MQTFLPDPSFIISAKILDYKRLGKQRVEAFQIINMLEKMKLGKEVSHWQYHPAVKMWEGCETLLKVYFNTMVKEWVNRGYKNNMKVYEIDYSICIATPDWLCNDLLHSSHRANLLRKLPEYYSKFKWEENPLNEYWWPWRRINKQWVKIN